MPIRPVFLLALAAALFGAGRLTGQAPAGASVVVVADGTSRVFTLAEVARLPRAAVTATQHGTVHLFEGVALAELLRSAGALPAGSAADGTAGAWGNLRGPALARYVVVTAGDGYRAVMSLAELDPATVPAATGGPVVLADRADGSPLAAADGPLRPVRSVRGVVRIEVRAAP